MRLHKFFIAGLLLTAAATLHSCKQSPTISTLSEKDYAPMLRFLSSYGLEGREVGTRGATIASDYIASMMELYGLEPCGDQNTYFQNFNLTRCDIEQLELSLNLSGQTVRLVDGVDYETERICKTIDATLPLIFVSHGVNAKQNGYNDYAGTDVKGKVVVLMNGYPGHSDTTSAGWKSFQNVDIRENTSLKAKRKAAWEQGAAAIIVVSAEKKIVSTTNDTGTYPLYTDVEYLLDSELSNPPIPCFKLSAEASQRLLASTNISLSEVERLAAQQQTPSPATLDKATVMLSIKIKPEVVKARNVVGMVKGKDTSKCVMVAAHYDHLGLRGQYTYNGADDNASGVAGMLAIAKYWKDRSEQLPCNIIFASWTAEEKGMIGSHYYAQQLNEEQQRSMLLSMNFDMLSRSEPDDTARRIVTVGRLKGHDDFKTIAEQSNSKLTNPLVLDLWETAGAGGSDYISFAEKGIPTMSFFSGSHADYHTPGDVISKIEWDKMTDILNLANGCIEEFLKTLKK